MVEREIGAPWEGFLVEPAGGGSAAVLVLGGSSGRVEAERCRLLAARGLTALSIRWFGGPGQAAGIREIPLETFTAAVDLLSAAGPRRIGVLGTSKGAEAALLLAVADPRIDAAIALAPTSVVWEGFGAGPDGSTGPGRSSWTWKGEPLPFVRYDRASWPPPGRPAAFLGMYESSREGYAAAAIDVAASRAELLLVAGGDDLMWPSARFAAELAARRDVRLVTHPRAGHRVRLPGEPPLPRSPIHQYGGTPEADAALGTAAWPDVLELLAAR
ncbi:acyl-CoA thioesterase [Nonomuraea sp. NN258]|uniref:acyl-CoA thioester hydrolase/BAAT C-terminal domain-containing protein n=1 Tax=Nonomuraea antri TaxID=2730852 RepID=UPI0015691E49|nr:acyl-CoA thioester hydrolase/BAAT C-terminal domain-containing protein [Nonomuraea antri]NRQ37045.1 acyl-CoA thioesterase [Nonomuraea antri]